MMFDNPDALMQAIENAVELAMRNDLSKVAVDIVKDQLDKDLYSRPESDYYVRTGELRNSVIATYDDNFASRSARGLKRLIIDHNTTRTFMPSGHRSWVTDRIQNSNIPDWISNGHQGVLPEPFIGINYFDNSYRRIVEIAVPTLVTSLRAKGIEAYAL